MYSTYKALIEKLESGDEQAITYVKQDPRLALGVVFYREILVDGRVRSEEVELFRTIVETHLGVSEDELHTFEQSAREMATSKETFDLLVNELKVLPEDEKSAIISFMQDISISDREFHELEVNLVSQVSKLLRAPFPLRGAPPPGPF